MDATFFQGAAAFVSALMIFCGSVWLLLTMVVGARLAYFVTASITLGFVSIMGVVWSINPLGPVGKLPEWDPVSIAESADQVEFGPASSYPGDPWRAVNQDDDAEVTKAGELSSDATDYLEEALDDDKIEAFVEVGDAAVTEDSARLLEQEGDEYGAVAFEPTEGAEGGTAVAVMKYDPGNPLGPARMITAGTLALFVLHLIGLSRSEARAKRREEIEASTGTTA